MADKDKLKAKDHLAEEVMLYGHKLPTPNEHFCSQCRKSIIHGLHNVVRINKAPVAVFSPSGQRLGVEGKLEARAFFHATCFQKVADRQKLKGRVECKYCGVLSMAKITADNRKVKDMCKCSCHNQSDFCSLLIR